MSPDTIIKTVSAEVRDSNSLTRTADDIDPAATLRTPLQIGWALLILIFIGWLTWLGA